MILSPIHSSDSHYDYYCYRYSSCFRQLLNETTRQRPCDRKTYLRTDVKTLSPVRGHHLFALLGHKFAITLPFNGMTINVFSPLSQSAGTLRSRKFRRASENVCPSDSIYLKANALLGTGLTVIQSQPS